MQTAYLNRDASGTALFFLVQVHHNGSALLDGAAASLWLPFLKLHIDRDTWPRHTEVGREVEEECASAKKERSESKIYS